MKRKHKGAQIEKKCVMCGGTFQAIDPWGRERDFCSKAHSSRWTAKHRPTTKGFYITRKGYKMIYIPNHPEVGKHCYIAEHRLVMEKVLGRPIKKTEIVHHLNWNKADNRPENLEVMDKQTHDRLPKPSIRPIECPHCHKMIRVSGRVRNAVVMG